MMYFKILIVMLMSGSVAVAQDYSIDWYVIASGGGHAESENYQADGTAGQSIVGQSSSENYTVDAGYWVGLPSSGGDCVYAPGDCNHNTVPIELEDIMYMIAMYAGDVPPSYLCECPDPGDSYAATADPNGNCIGLELEDIMWEISAYSGDVTAYGCVDCPGDGPPPPAPPGSGGTTVIPSLKSKVKINQGSAD
jgi:hypothetical protein